MRDGSLKSTLMDILEKLDTGRNIEGCTVEDLHASFYKRLLHLRIWGQLRSLHQEPLL